MTDLVPALADLSSVSLPEVLERAAALVRVDRKYLLPRSLLPDLLNAVADSFQVLEIDGRRSTTYTSRYLDTHDLASCRAHLQGRRRRWKVRVRRYHEDDLTRVEVKTRDGRGATRKSVLDIDGCLALRDDGALGEDAAAFVAECLGQEGFSVDVAHLQPTMHVSYRRATLAALDAGQRMTLDTDMLCTLDGRGVSLDRDYLVVETKGGPRQGIADRALVGLGVRPRSLSKYASAASLLRDDLADNDVRRLHGVQLHTDPRQAQHARAS
jgi:hypothetical protein